MARAVRPRVTAITSLRPPEPLTTAELEQQLGEGGLDVALEKIVAAWEPIYDASDVVVVEELYQASLAGVPIVRNVRGLCCLRAGVPGLSPTIQVFSVVGRFLEHSRIYRCENGGAPEFFIGSADLMTRNLPRRVEAVAPVRDPAIKAELEEVLRTYEEDNCSAWDMHPTASMSAGTRPRARPGTAPSRRSSSAPRRNPRMGRQNS